MATTTNGMATTRTRSGRVIYLLTAIAVVFSLGHHVDHVIRGNHVGWPLTDQVTVFTISLGIYPILLAAVLLYRAGRIGAGVWALLSGNGALFVAGVHFGPLAVESPRDILDPYPTLLGWFWFGWLIVFVGVLVVTCVVETRLWLRQRAGRARSVSTGATGR
ncbi:hypothetical protein [Enemella evansiae]|uniref:hypothetical protein n=1 Tax=Enemella evansiae TaxID=2016499 RepID=UPI0015C59F40|nr:hypothetical protein [Enemella evansiae]